ncbi:hypothetical protein [Bradyrhizobium sp.]|uniref:hypothetical protein n=1 Tax=Bradyrhizobium sp. TaxID=376 RepID=UPI003D113348
MGSSPTARTSTAETLAKALAHLAGFLSDLKRPFDQNLQRAGISLPYLFARRLHIHGGSSYSGSDAKISAIIKKSWGKWNAPDKHTQVHFQRLRDDDCASHCMERQGAEDDITPKVSLASLASGAHRSTQVD